MLSFVIKRIGSMLGVIIALTFVLFVLQEASGTDPAKAYVGANASQAALEQARIDLGLDQPFLARYLGYLGGLLHGDLQNSVRTRTPVADSLATAFPATIELALWALGFALVLALGYAAAAMSRRRGTGAVRLTLMTGAAAPTFLLAMLGLLLFYGVLGWLPAGGRASGTLTASSPTGLLVLDSLLAGDFTTASDAVAHLLLPALCASIGPAVAIGRVLVNGLGEAMVSDHARTARSAGMTETQVLRRHGIRNSLTGTLSMTGVQAGMLLAGLVVIEKIFRWPGIGTYLDQSVATGDFPGIAGVALLLGISYVLVNTVVDLAQVAADRRIAIS